MKSKTLLSHINTALTDYIVWVLLIVIFLVGCTIEPSFSSSINILNIFSHVVPMAMLVFGLSFLLMLGRLDLSMESTFALAPILANLIVMKWFPFIPTIFNYILLSWYRSSNWLYKWIFFHKTWSK